MEWVLVFSCWLIAMSALFGSLFMSEVNIYNNNKHNEASKASMEYIELIQRDYSPRMGPSYAKVTIVEFFDPAPGTCSAFYPLVKQIMGQNQGKVNLVLRYLPLHQSSGAIVSIFEAARLQNSFWETLKFAYKTRDAWIEHHVAKPEKLWVLLGDTDLNMEKLNDDLQSDEIARRVKQDMHDAQKLNLRKTPVFLLMVSPW